MRLLSGVLPEQITVDIIVPNFKGTKRQEYPVTLPPNPRIMSPRLVNEADALHFAMDVLPPPAA